jgi:hypothetical protein
MKRIGGALNPTQPVVRLGASTEASLLNCEVNRVKCLTDAGSARTRLWGHDVGHKFASQARLQSAIFQHEARSYKKSWRSCC